jgi:predicted RNA-binding protein YlxR (DUF448 family)
MKPKQEMVRVVSHEGRWSVDERGKSPGRGAYICKDVHCLDTALRERRFEKHLKQSLPPDEREELTRQLSAVIARETERIQAETYQPVVKRVMREDGTEQIIRVVRKGKKNG